MTAAGGNFDGGAGFGGELGGSVVPDASAGSDASAGAGGSVGGGGSAGGGGNGGAGGERKGLGEWALFYGASERTLKRWRARGLERGDEFPMRDPERVPGWWQRNMEQKAPHGIHQAVLKWRLERRGAGAGVIEAKEVAVGNAVGTGMPEVPVGELPVEDRGAARARVFEQAVDASEMGTAKVLERLMETEVRLSRLAGEPGQATPWLNTVARIGPLVEKLRKEDELQRKLIPRAEAEAAIQALHLPIKNELYLMAGAMCEAVGVPLVPSIEERWRLLVDGLLKRLSEEVFA